ncbi:MAG: phosphopentomutase [Deltaproteobacteria bacterium]|nr:phosphopentomutase [Deltaproteobacteria bacterium]
MLKRAIILVLDGFGVGELPDAVTYGDGGSDTLDNTARFAGGLDIPNLASLGLGLIEGVERVERVLNPIASFGRMREASPGKDTATGHWEMSGVVLDKMFATYPEGFPPEMLKRFEKDTGYGCLGGRPASGTRIIEELGEEHLRTGKLIVYTSADSVFQIAAHEDVIPIEELYRVCRIAREFLYGYNVGRVIARPFRGRPGSFKRTEGRKDYSIEPPGETVLEKIKGKGLPVVGVGKIGDIFVHRGLTEEIHTKGDADGIDKTVSAIGKFSEGLIFTNLVDLDTLYGHRNDHAGYARALAAIDLRLPEIMEPLTDEDIFIITADHGCDPTTPSTDHSREYAPLIVYGKGLRAGVDLGTRATFADIGQTLSDIFGAGRLANGVSFLPSVVRQPFP